MIQLSEPVVFANVLKIRQKLFAALDSHSALEVDFSLVGRCDSSALALLLSCQRHAKSQGKSIHWRNLPQSLLDVAQVCGMVSLLTLDH